MKLTRMVVGTGMTIPTDSYENVKPYIELEAVLLPDDNPEEVYQSLREKTKAYCLHHAYDLGANVQDRIREDFSGFLESYFDAVER
jgi:hypothetical protein